jgi:hypothetical protein
MRPLPLRILLLLPSSRKLIKMLSYTFNRLSKSVGLWDVSGSTSSIQSAHRWCGCQPLSTGRVLSPGNSCRGWVEPRAVACLAGLGQLKNLMDCSRNERTTFRLVAHCLSNYATALLPLDWYECNIQVGSNKFRVSSLQVIIQNDIIPSEDK